ncbi:MAG TPA: GerMN domain-containing protein [Anaerolineae bacterium]|jgi:hypothetical protein|nr:GerMN domain-containing protein [Anaerolineae bacterium]
MKRSLILLIVLLLLLSIALIGCPQLVPRQPTGRTTEPTISPTTTTEKETTITLYFIEEREDTMFLVPEKRSIPQTKAIARAALEELIKGSKQPGRFSVIPPETKIRSVKIANGLATVDFSKEVLNANVGAPGEELGIAQIVNTLTEFPTINRVMFLVEGRDRGTIDGREIQDWWGHVGLSDQPFSRREDLIQGGKVVSNTVRVESPRAFTSVESPLTVRGQARVFEAQFQVRVLDKNGTVLAEVPVMSEGFDWGNFSKQISFRKPKEPGRGTVLFFFFSPKDGSEVTMGSVTVFLK